MRYDRPNMAKTFVPVGSIYLTANQAILTYVTAVIRFAVLDGCSYRTEDERLDAGYRG